MNTLFVLLQEAQPKGGMFAGLLPLLLIMVVFIFLFILPQRKRAKETQRFRDELKKGDKIVTIGGLHGKITEVKEHTVMVSLAPEVVIEIEKSALVQNASQVGGQA